MAKNSVIIIGKNRLAQEMLDLSEAGGFETRIYADAYVVFDSASLVIETYARDEAEKREIIKKIGRAHV